MRRDVLIRSMRLVLLAALLLGVLAPPRPVLAARRLPVEKQVLDNGLTVLVLPDHSIPSASLYIFYKVGSRNEVPGRTGLAHFFEHMMFKPTYPSGRFDEVMEAAGGSNNAFTTNDVTVYTDWFPVQALDTVLRLEADRMGNLVITPEEVAAERAVVLQERRLRTDGDPHGALDELFNATAYVAHSYRWPVIGWETDIRAWMEQDIAQFHEAYYRPNNAVLVLVGDVQAEEAFAKINSYFGQIPSGPPPAPVRTQEPLQRGERRAVLNHAAQLPALEIGYHVPASADDSAPTMKVLETVLLGGQSSRLYRRLIDRDRSALSVSGGYGEWNFDPTLFQFDIRLKGNHRPLEVEQALYQELEKLRTKPVPELELRRAKNIILADLYRSQRTLDGKALLVGVFEVFHGEFDGLERWADRIEAVTPEMVQDFASRWFVPANRTVVTLVPTPEPQLAPSTVRSVEEQAPARHGGQAAAPAGSLPGAPPPVEQDVDAGGAPPAEAGTAAPVAGPAGAGTAAPVAGPAGAGTAAPQVAAPAGAGTAAPAAAPAGAGTAAPPVAAPAEAGTAAPAAAAAGEAAAGKALPAAPGTASPGVAALPAPPAGQASQASAPSAPAAVPAGNPEVKLPPYQRVVLDNGLVLLLMEQHEVPLLHVQVMVHSGAAADPAGKEGVADLTASLLRRGTRSRGTDELVAAIDFLGARVGGGASQEKSSIHANFLVKDREQAMALLAEMLQQPSFPQHEVDKELARLRDAVRQAKDKPSAVLGQYLVSFFYGPDHPYGRPVAGDESSLKRIARKDVVAFHRTAYVPGNVAVAIVGDLPTEQMLELARRHFGAWRGGPAPRVVIPTPPAPAPGRVLLVDKPDAPQAHFAFVAPGLRRTDPDRTAVSVVNTLFGGRFSSWLNQKLRVEAGLTYGAGSGFSAGSQPGHFVMRSFTETPNTARAIELALEQLDRLHRAGPGEAELASVRAYLKGQFPPTIETPGDLAAELIELEQFGLGRDEVDGYMQRVDEVDLAEARRIIARWFPAREGLVTVIIGKAAELRELAAGLGQVTEKSITAPGFGF